VNERLRRAGEEWAGALVTIDERPAIPFNAMADWGPDGRIVPGAPVFSPFVRRKQTLDLE
jgi:NAD(P)H dehydrogenase (quinone)